jgi:mannose-P-dolichol utilization defect 1
MVQQLFAFFASLGWPLKVLETVMSNNTCPITLLKENILDKSCLSLLVSKVFGYAGVLALGKFFTLINMLTNHSSKGLDATSLYLEHTGFFTTVYYNYLRGNGLSTYIDNVSAGVQVTLMVLLMWWYESADVAKLVSDNFMTIAAAVLFYGVLLATTPEYYHFIISYSILVKLLCKIPQIITNHRIKSTGVQSVSSMGFAAFNGFTKVFIVLRETPDDTYLVAGAVLNLVLTVILLAQGVMYGSSGAVVVAPAPGTTVVRVKKSSIVPKSATPGTAKSPARSNSPAGSKSPAKSKTPKSKTGAPSRSPTPTRRRKSVNKQTVGDAASLEHGLARPLSEARQGRSPAARAKRREFIVESVLRHTGSFSMFDTLRFEVKWEGYPSTENTMEPWKHVQDCEPFHEYLRSIGKEALVPRPLKK